MYTTVVKNYELPDRLNALSKLVDGKIRTGLAFQVVRLIKVLREQFDLYSERRNMLFNEGVERDADGSPVASGEDRFKIKPDYIEQFQELDIQTGDSVKQILLSTLVVSVDYIEVATIVGLGDLIYDDTEVDAANG